MKKWLAFAAAATMGALALSGCGGSSSSSDVTLEEMTGAWVLESGKGAAGELKPVDGVPVELNVEQDGTFSANAGCNNLFGSLTVENGKLDIGPVASTMMACDDRLMKIERAYTQALDRVRAGSSSAGMMTLWGDGTVLRYGRAK